MRREGGLGIVLQDMANSSESPDYAVAVSVSGNGISSVFESTQRKDAAGLHPQHPDSPGETQSARERVLIRLCGGDGGVPRCRGCLTRLTHSAPG